jgi:hypothetical protein
MDRSQTKNNNVWNYLSMASPWERGSIIKQQALLIFYRNMLSICTLTALICVLPRLNALLPVLHCHYWRWFILAICFCFVFLASWLHQSNSLDAWEEFINEDLENRKKGHGQNKKAHIE